MYTLYEDNVCVRADKGMYMRIMCVDSGMCVYTDNVCVYRRAMACVCVQIKACI